MIAHAYYLRDARVRREAECLAKEGYEVHVVCAREPIRTKDLPEPSHEIVNGVHIHRLPLKKERGSKWRYFFEYLAITVLGAWKLILLSLRKRFDVVHIHNMPDLLVAAGLIPRWMGAVLILDIHDPMSEMFRAKYHLQESHPLIRLLKVQEWISYRLANYVMTVSIPMAENIAKKRGCCVEKVKIIHNFPDASRFPIREDRNGWPYNGDSIVFLYSGTVSEHYRLDMAVRAFALVSQSIPNIHFWILGAGNRLHEVLALAKKLGIADRVKHIPPVDQAGVRDVMALVDAGITTHESGGFGDLYFSTKIIEFMTQGLPVLSSRTRTLEKYIPEDAIFYFEPGRVKDLAKQIISMIKNPGVVQERIKNSRKILYKCMWQEEKSNLLSFYRELRN
jgi:glycosyltransferase involved in cell wall biosynthesis